MLSGWLSTKGIRKFKVNNKGKTRGKDKGTPVQRFFTLRHFEEQHPSQAASHAAATFVAAQKSKRDSSSSTRSLASSYNVRDMPNTCGFLAVPYFELRYEREQIFYSMGKSKPKPLGSISLCAHSVVSFLKESGKDSVS